jgi:threonine-phosphate decarboxylase
MIKGHGDDIHNYKGIKANFSSNVCADGPHPSLVAHLKGALSSLEQYPEPCAESLTQRLAECYHLLANQVLVCNGATEAFYLLAHHYRGQKSLIFTPSFSEYEDACTSAHHPITYADNQLYTSVNYADVDLVWLCNPNNPDAFCYDFQVLTDIIKSNPQCLFIIDEAYIEFARGQRSFIPLFATLHNVVVIRSMTKRYSIPALRLGYMLGNAKVMASISKNVMPWRLNTLALKAGEFVLSSDYADDFDQETVLTQSQALQNEIGKIEGIELLPSNASFFLLRSNIPATRLKQRLVEDYGLLIRDASNFRGLSPYHFRVAVQSEQNNKLLVHALKEIFTHG